MRKTQIAIYAMAAFGLCLMIPKGAGAFPAAAGTGKAHTQAATDDNCLIRVRGFHGGGGFHGGAIGGGFGRGIGFRGGYGRGFGYGRGYGRGFGRGWGAVGYGRGFGYGRGWGGYGSGDGWGGYGLGGGWGWPFGLGLGIADSGYGSGGYPGYWGGTGCGLRRAHQELDTAVDRLYRKEPFTSDRERAEHLFGLYEKLTSGMLAAQSERKKRRA